MENTYIIPRSFTAGDIKQIRKKLNMTQKELACFLGCSKPTIERWEISTEELTGPAVTLLYLLSQSPDLAQKLSVPPREKPIRMWYMYLDEKCTLIDVDDCKKEVSIKNYTDQTQFRAFGVNEHPDYEGYEEFLKSRCFPESRDKMKLILDDMGLPFYDPYLIVRKTQGRMSEDDFWIYIEDADKEEIA